MEVGGGGSPTVVAVRLAAETRWAGAPPIKQSWILGGRWAAAGQEEGRREGGEGGRNRIRRGRRGQPFYYKLDLTVMRVAPSNRRTFMWLQRAGAIDPCKLTHQAIIIISENTACLAQEVCACALVRWHQ